MFCLSALHMSATTRALHAMSDPFASMASDTFALTLCVVAGRENGGIRIEGTE